MSYRPRHASLPVSAKAAARGAAVVGAAAVIGVIGIGAPAGAAAAPLSVTLGTQVQNDGSSTAWSSAGNPVLTLGSDAATTGAYITLDNAPAEVPATGPTFTTDNYAAGSPRFVITLSNGKSLWGYPPNAGLNGSDFAWTVNNGNTYTSWEDALTAAGVDSSTTVTGVQIVADGDQASAASTRSPTSATTA